MTETSPGEAFANTAMTYISIGQASALLAFLICAIWIWSLSYQRMGGLGGFSVGMVAGLAFGLLAGVVTFLAWPLVILGLLVFWVTRYPVIRQGRAQP